MAPTLSFTSTGFRAGIDRACSASRARLIVPPRQCRGAPRTEDQRLAGERTVFVALMLSTRRARADRALQKPQAPRVFALRSPRAAPPEEYLVSFDALDYAPSEAEGPVPSLEDFTVCSIRISSLFTSRPPGSS